MADTILLDTWILARLAGGVMDDAVAPAGLVAREFVLYALLDRTGPLTPTELARTSGVPATTISKMVRRMGERNHLVELDNPDDARSRLLQLSPEGAAVLGDAESGYAKLASELTAALGAEVPQIEWSLERLRAALVELSGGRSLEPAQRPSTAQAHIVHYAGRALDEHELAQVRQFIDFVRRNG